MFLVSEAVKAKALGLDTSDMRVLTVPTAQAAGPIYEDGRDTGDRWEHTGQNSWKMHEAARDASIRPAKTAAEIPDLMEDFYSSGDYRLDSGAPHPNYEAAKTQWINIKPKKPTGGCS